MFDRDGEEKDLDNQVSTTTNEKGSAANADALPEKIDPEDMRRMIEKNDAALPDDAKNAFGPPEPEKSEAKK